MTAAGTTSLCQTPQDLTSQYHSTPTIPPERCNSHPVQLKNLRPSESSALLTAELRVGPGRPLCDHHPRRSLVPAATDSPSARAGLDAQGSATGGTLSGAQSSKVALLIRCGTILLWFFSEGPDSLEETGTSPAPLVLLSTSRDIKLQTDGPHFQSLSSTADPMSPHVSIAR